MKRITTAKLCTLAFVLALATSCSLNNEGLEVVRADQDFAMQVGETVALKGSSLNVTFLGITNDSRCPSNVLCVWAGEVTAQFKITDNESSKSELELTSPNEASANFDTYTIEMTKVEPYPEAPEEINPEDYWATMTIKKR